MEKKYLILYKNNYVEATSDAPKTQECILQLWNKIIDTCKKRTCTKILNISDSTTPITVRQALDYLRSFESLKINSDYRIAMVELNPACGESALLVETLLSSNGINIRAFLNIGEARSWLFFGKCT